MIDLLGRRRYLEWHIDTVSRDSGSCCWWAFCWCSCSKTCSLRSGLKSTRAASGIVFGEEYHLFAVFLHIPFWIVYQKGPVSSRSGTGKEEFGPPLQTDSRHADDCSSETEIVDLFHENGQSRGPNGERGAYLSSGFVSYAVY